MGDDCYIIVSKKSWMKMWCVWVCYVMECISLSARIQNCTLDVIFMIFDIVHINSSVYYTFFDKMMCSR